MMWFDYRKTFSGILSEIEPMIVGLSVAIIIHLSGLIFKSVSFDERK